MGEFSLAESVRNLVFAHVHVPIGKMLRLCNGGPNIED